MTPDDWDDITKPYEYPPQPERISQLPTERELERPSAPETLPAPPPDFFDEEEFINLPADPYERTECSTFSNCYSQELHGC